MPSFESIRPFKRARVESSDDLTGCDHRRNDSDCSLAKSNTHAEGDNKEKPGFLRTTWKRCKRPGSSLVARHIGQPILAKSSLVLLSASLHNPTSSTVDVSMRVTLTVPIPFPVLLQPMVVRLCRNGHASDDPFLEVALPACQIRRSTEIEVNGKTTNVLNMKQFGDLLNDAMFNESVMLGINGSAKVQFHGVTSRLHLDDRVEVKGLDSFPGFVVKSCQILLPKAPDWALFEFILDLPNPSLTTIEMGDLTMNLYVGPILVGETFASNVTLTPGPNTVLSRVYIDKKAVMSNITTIIQSQKQLLCRGKLGVRVSGKSIVRNGESLVYYENALSKLQLYSMLPLVRILGYTVGGIAESVTPENVLTRLRTMGIMAILEGNGVDMARLTLLHEQPE